MIKCRNACTGGDSTDLTVLPVQKQPEKSLTLNLLQSSQVSKQDCFTWTYTARVHFKLAEPYY